MTLGSASGTRGRGRAPRTEDTLAFYDGLAAGKCFRRALSGRFDALRVSERPLVRKYFTERIAPLIGRADRVLDFGCGPGTFLIPVARLCAEVIGVDTVNSTS